MKDVKCLFCFLLTLLLFSCEKNEPIEQDAKLVVSDTIVMLSPNNPYAKITISKGAGNYMVSSSDETIAQNVLIDNKLYIAGNNIGNAVVTLTDQDKNEVRIRVKISKYIARELDYFSNVSIKIGDTKTIATTGPNALYYLIDTASVIRVGGASNNVQITAQKIGNAKLSYLKEFWPSLIYYFQVIDHYPFIVSPNTGSRLLSVGTEADYGIISGCGNYSLTISDTNVISAELLAWPFERTLQLNNPRFVHIKALQKGTSELKITNVETDEVKTEIFTVR